MSENRFDILASKYLTDELNDIEVLEFENLISSNEYYKYEFKEFVSVNSFIEETKANTSSQEAFKDFLNTIETPNIFQYKKALKYVAIVSGIILSVLVSNFIFNNTESDPRMALVIPNEDIILYNEDGRSQKVEIDYNKAIKNEFSGLEGLKIGDEIIYEGDKNKTSDKVTNYTLKVPFGKKFGLTLSDGSKVYLNSGSSITYPNTFNSSSKRVVTLQGEAYFEVKSNKKKPFIVKTDLLNIRVLGTKFNVSAYKNDNSNSVTLVEGKVAVGKSVAFKNQKSKSILLEPNQRAFAKRNSNNTIIKKQVASVSKYISWKNRELEFKNDKFIDITKKLERNFNVKIVSNNKRLNNIEFTGNFNKQDVFDILDSFRVHTPFTYTVENNNILIKK